MINISEMIHDPDFAQVYTILRTQGYWEKGRFVSLPETQLSVHGVVTACNVRDLQMVPEADRVVGMMCFYSTEVLNITRSNDQEEGLSDIAIWRNEKYKLVQVLPEMDYGYYKAFGARIVGK